MRYNFFFLYFFIFYYGCASKVEPNEWVVTTATCWNTYTVTKAGSMIPRLYTNCDRMIRLPATELSGDFTGQTKFKNRVSAKVNFTYQWMISDPALFVKSAKSITSSTTDNQHRVTAQALETIENAVVDKMLIDIIRAYTPDKEAGIEEAKIEKDLTELAEVNFSQRGVTIKNVSVNVNFDPQTEEALGVISALKFYEQCGEYEFGKEVIKAKASATKIIIINKNDENDETQEVEEEK